MKYSKTFTENETFCNLASGKMQRDITFVKTDHGIISMVIFPFLLI